MTHIQRTCRVGKACMNGHSCHCRANIYTNIYNNYMRKTTIYAYILILYAYNYMRDKEKLLSFYYEKKV